MTTLEVHGTPLDPITVALFGVAAVWFALGAALGFSGFYGEHTRIIFVVVLAPILIFVGAFAALPGLRNWAFGLDIRALVFFQAVRLGGIAFLAVYAVGKLNGTFALWGGLLDVAIGASAPFAAAI